MPGWFQRNDVNNDGGQQKPFELTDEHFERIATDTSKKLEGGITQKLSELVNNALGENPILKRLGANLDASEQRRQQQQQQQQQQNAQQQQKTYTEALEEVDPAVATVINHRMSAVEQTAMRAAAREERRSIFEDVEAFPYYTGEIKAKVDEMIDKESIEVQSNPTLIRNAYKIVLADHMQQIQDGKLRSRLSSSAGSATLPVAQQVDPNALPTLNASEKAEAAKFGMKEEDYAKAKKELMESGVL